MGGIKGDWVWLWNKMLESHMDHVHDNKEMMDELQTARTERHSQVERQKLEHAQELKQSAIDAKKKAAQSSLDDVTGAQIRKELHDDIHMSETERKAHDMELKQEMADARRADILHGVQEKQAHLQHGSK